MDLLSHLSMQAPPGPVAPRRLPDEVLGAGFEFVRLEVDQG